MALTVIHGGRKPKRGHSPPPKMGKYLEALWKAVPALSRNHIAERMSKMLGESITEWMVDYVLKYVRQHADELGWTVHYAKRGTNVLGEPRFIPIMMKRDGTFLNENEELACDDGLIATLTALKALNERETSMLEAYCAHLPGRKKPRMLTGIGVDLTHAAAKIADALDELRENGA